MMMTHFHNNHPIATTEVMAMFGKIQVNTADYMSGDVIGFVELIPGTPYAINYDIMKGSLVVNGNTIGPCSPQDASGFIHYIKSMMESDI